MYLLRHLKALTASADITKMDSKQLSIVIGHNIFGLSVLEDIMMASAVHDNLADINSMNKALEIAISNAELLIRESNINEDINKLL